MNKTSNRGGRRDGSGRRPTKTPRENVTFRVSPETKFKIAALRRAGFRLGEQVDAMVEGLYDTICSDAGVGPNDL